MFVVVKLCTPDIRFRQHKYLNILCPILRKILRHKSNVITEEVLDDSSRLIRNVRKKRKYHCTRMGCYILLSTCF